MTMQPWFGDAKLGIFIHWGIYAVNGIAESWSFFTGEVTYPAYLSQLDGFTAQRYDPDTWAKLFRAAGARYAVLTAKHHDGVALWDTGASDLSVVRRTPAGRDLIGPYAEALRRNDLRVGLYFSHLDWSHPDYATVRPSVVERNREAVYGTVSGLPAGLHYGPSTLSADRRTLYLTCFDAPREFVALRGVRNRIRRVSVLGSGTELAHRVVGGFQEVPGVTYVEAPEELDEYATMLAVELDGELDLYRGTGFH